MAKRNEAPVGGEPVAVADDAIASRGGLNQKPRSMAEAHKAWGRRIRRKAKRYDGPDLRGLLEALAGTDPASIPRDATGLQWVRKGSAAECGEGWSAALFSGMAAKV